MKKIIYLVIFGCTAHFLPAEGQRLHPFTSYLESVDNAGTKEPVPYKRTLSYFDCVEGKSKPDSIVGRLPSYWIEFELPSEVNEIGIRFISPDPENFFADAGDVVTESYTNRSRARQWFDPVIMLEQWSMIDSIQGWKVLGTNDNATDAPSQPDGQSNNAVLRIHAGPYQAGKYRIRYQSATKNAPQGCFLLQLGTVPGLKGLSFPGVE